MKWKFVNFYPFQVGEKKNKKLIGTCHVFDQELKINIRGIKVIEHRDTFIFRFPSNVQQDPVKKKNVNYPTFSYEDPSKNRQLIEFLRKNSGLIRKTLPGYAYQSKNASNSNRNTPRIDQKTKKVST